MKFSTQSYLTSSPGFPLSWFWKLKRCCETKKSWAGKTLNKAFNEALEHLKDFENPFCSPLFGPKLLIKFDPHSQRTETERFHSGFHHFVNQPMPRLPMAVTQLSSASALLAHMHFPPTGFLLCRSVLLHRTYSLILPDRGCHFSPHLPPFSFPVFLITSLAPEPIP